jgi:hypothetical protein
MRLATRLGLIFGLAFVAAGGSAAAAPKRISGTLSESGYTVIALATNGKARAVVARGGGFTLRPPARTVTLHLRDVGGDYAGPIVLRGSGRRAVLGIRAGGRLGRIEVLDGYARPTRRPRSRWLDRRRWSRAKDGVPIAVGNFGRVRSRRVRSRVPGDRDVDGIPDRLDIDDDGDLVLDKLDRSRRARAAQDAARDPFDLASGMAVPLEQTANVNAGSTDAQIDATLPLAGYLLMSVPRADSVELDCGGTSNPSPPPPLVGGLTYCSYGGTGRIDRPPPGNVFPECCDADGDGYGTVEATQIGPDFVSFTLRHGATSSQIGTADTLILRITDAGQETQLADMHQFIFATVPALASYVDEAGRQTVVAYPVAPGDPGTAENGFPVVDGPDADSDVEVTVTLWRPQRRPTSDEECVQPPVPSCTENEWIDVGGLDYTASSREGFARTNDTGWCPQDAFEVSDPTLSAGFPDPQGGGFRDLASDKAPNPANTFTYELNLTRCLRAYGIGFAPGDTQIFSFESFTPIRGGGTAGVDNAAAQASFTRR